MQTLDWIVITLYFVVLGGIAWWVMRQKQNTTTDYFLAGRNVGWFVIGASIFASNIGSEHLVGLAGAGASSGVVLGAFELQSWIVLLLGWVFVPFYIRSQVFTMPEFLERRFGPNARWFLSLVSLIGYVLTKVSVTVYAGGIVIQTMLGIDFWTGALITLIITGVYTIFGGLRAVVYTEALQTFVLIAGSVTVTVIGLHKIGGWSHMQSLIEPTYFNLWRSASDPKFPWTGIVFGAPIVGIWYWCTDQYIVQRTLAAKDEKNARRGSIFAGYLKILPFFIFLIPGMVAMALVNSGKLQMTSADQAFPSLVMNLLPDGFRGLVVGGLLAALMSSLSSVFNSCSTLFTVDIYEKIRPGKPQKHLVTVGRIATGIIVLLGILWIPVMKGISGQLYDYLQSVQSYLAPPIAAVFILGVFYKRINNAGAMTTLIGGFILGMLRLAAELNKDSLHGWLFTFADMNFLHFCILLFLVCIAMLIIVSLFTNKPPYEKLNGLTYATTVAEDKAASRASWNYWDILNSAVILIILGWAYFYFSSLGIG